MTMSDILERLRWAFDGDDVPKKNIAIRKAHDEITALRSLLEQAEKERDEADRRAGAAERNLAWRAETVQKTRDWRDSWKERLGYDRSVSFDKVWADVLGRAEAAEKALADARNAAFEEAEMPDAIDAHEKPRYTTRRLHYEIDKAKKQGRNEAFEEAARIVESAPLANDASRMTASAIRAKVTP